MTFLAGNACSTADVRPATVTPAPTTTLPPHRAGYWLINTPGTAIDISAPYTLVLTATTGESLTITVPALIGYDLSVNFAG